MARAFNTTQYLENTSPVVTAAPFTISVWFNQTSAASRRQMVTNSAGSYHGWYLMSDTGGTLKFDAYDGGLGTAAAVGTHSTGVWHHACAVEAATNSRTVYLNGTAGAPNTTSVTPTAGSAKFTVGTYNPDYAQMWTGNMAEVAVWNVALTAAEIAVLADAVCPLLIRPASLLSYFPLWGRFTVENDLVGNSPLTNTNTTYADHPRVIMPRQRQLILPQAAVGGGGNRRRRIILCARD